jgi:DNA-binding NtrC family response regulator
VAAARVVIVDDEEVFLGAASRILSRAGYVVFPANRPLLGLEIIRDNAPVDLVISDVSMPDMRGTELLRETARITPGTARLLITGGLLDPAEVPEGVPVLRKPFTSAELISAISAALERSAQISISLARSEQKYAGLQAQSQRLISECENLVRESTDMISKSRANRTPAEQERK